MRVIPIKSPIIKPGDDLLKIIEAVVPKLSEKTVLVVTSKVVAVAEGSLIPKTTQDKAEKFALVKKEAELYIDPINSLYTVMLTIKHGVLGVNAGVDESNIEGSYVQLPADPFASADRLWQFLRNRDTLKEVGVVITDSVTLPLKWGVVGRSLGHAGFDGLRNLIGKKDLFGRELLMTQMNIAEGIAAAAVLEMGEGNESTPFCLVSEVSHLTFRQTSLTKTEQKTLKIALADDVYAPALKSTAWQAGGGS